MSSDKAYRIDADSRGMVDGASLRADIGIDEIVETVRRLNDSMT